MNTVTGHTGSAPPWKVYPSFHSWTGITSFFVMRDIGRERQWLRNASGGRKKFRSEETATRARDACNRTDEERV